MREPEVKVYTGSHQQQSNAADRQQNVHSVSNNELIAQTKLFIKQSIRENGKCSLQSLVDFMPGVDAERVRAVVQHMEEQGELFRQFGSDDNLVPNYL